MADQPQPAGQPPAQSSTVRTAELAVTGVLALFITIYIVVRIAIAKDGEQRLLMFQYGLAAICTLAIFSFLYRENPIYRFFEHVLVGLATGYFVGIEIVNVIIPNWWNKMVGAKGAPSDWTWIIFPLIGLLWYFQLFRNPKWNWYSRIPIFFFMGYGAALAYKGFFNMMFAKSPPGQVIDTLQRAVLPFTTVGFFDQVNNLLYILISMTVLSYFFFSFKHENNPLLRNSAKTGRYLLMIAFGAIFGTTVMGRMSLLIDRMYFLFHDWLSVVS
ncbi:MAG: hypothetical protein ACYS8W_00340 [Planctomycetota bacterium]|jgi:hypothetical protein